MGHISRASRVSPGRYHSFTVRIWSQTDSGEVTHGEVVDVASRQSMHFRDVASVAGFIESALRAGALGRVLDDAGQSEPH